MKRVAMMMMMGMMVAACGWGATEGAKMAPMICPNPTKAEISATEYHPLATVTIATADAEAVAWARTKLTAWYGDLAPVVKGAGESAADAAVAPEGAYRLVIGDKGVEIAAKTLAGVRYALYSLRQLAIAARGTKKLAGWIVPQAKIEDAPTMKFRGMHVCWFPETQPWMVERAIRLAAFYKFNYVVLETWGSFVSEVAPWYGWRDGRMTKAETRRLVALAKDLGVTLIPQLNVFGHATLSRIITGKHAALDVSPEYQPLFEPVGGWNWCLTNPETRKLLIALIGELHETFGNPPYFHIGCDEAHPPSCPECLKRPYSEILVEHIRAMREAIVARGAKPMMWQDQLLESGDARWEGFYAYGTKETAKAAAELPKDIVICDWYYEGPREDYPTLTYFKGLGYPVLTCPWFDAGGILAQGKFAREHGLDGILGTLWHHYYGQHLADIYVNTANAAWSAEPLVDAYGFHVRFMNDLRKIGWDMKLKDPERAGVYLDQVPRRLCE